MKTYFVSLDKTLINIFNIPPIDRFKSAGLSWNGTGGIEGENASFQFLLNGVEVYTKTIPYQSSEYLDMGILPYFNQVTTDKDGTRILGVTKN
jgi:hypothetical protein